MNVNRLVIVTLVNIIYSASHIHQISSSIVALLECIEIGVCSSSNILTYYCHVYISQLLLRSRLLLIMIACALLASTYQLRSIAQLLQYIHPLISVVITRLRLSLWMRHITQYAAGVTIFLRNDRRAMFKALSILLTGFPDFLHATLLSQIHAHRLRLNAAFFSQKSDQEV